jgi:hypothetical protein
MDWKVLVVFAIALAGSYLSSYVMLLRVFVNDTD